MNTSYSFVDTIYNLKKNDAIFLSDLAYAISDRHIGKLNEFSTKHCDGNYVVAGLIIDNFAQAVAEGYTYWEVKQCTLRVRFSEELHTKIDTGRADFSHNCYSKVTTIKTICSLTNCGLKQCKDALDSLEQYKTDYFDLPLTSEQFNIPSVLLIEGIIFEVRS